MEKKREENPSDVRVRPSATDWNERFSSLCGVLKGIKEEEEKERDGDLFRIMS